MNTAPPFTAELLSGAAMSPATYDLFAADSPEVVASVIRLTADQNAAITAYLHTQPSTVANNVWD